MPLRASRAVLRLVASCRFAWLTIGSNADVIVARFARLGMTAAVARERVQKAVGRIGEQQERARELRFRRALRVPRERENYMAAGDERRARYRVAVVEEMAASHDFFRKHTPCPAVMLAPCSPKASGSPSPS